MVAKFIFEYPDEWGIIMLRFGFQFNSVDFAFMVPNLYYMGDAFEESS